MKNLLYILIGLALFLYVSVYVLNSKETVKIKRVIISTQGVAISQQGTHLEYDIKEPENNLEIKQEKITYENPVTYKTSETTYTKSKQNQYKISKTSESDVQNYEYSELDNRLAKLKNIETTIKSNKAKNEDKEIKYNYKYKDIKNNNSDVNPEKKDNYGYEDINWNVWKSNFINKILDDSMDITSLNNYSVGTWFYYSFNVTNTGEIKDVSIRSFNLKEADKQRIKNMIYGYSHNSITVFPKNSKRKVAKVDAIMMLGETESKSRPEDFNDTERIRIKY